MSRHSEPGYIQVDEKGAMISPIMFHSGYDASLGEFFDITDKRFAGTKNDPQGEGYLFEWSGEFGISKNLIDAKAEDINNKERLVELVELFIKTKL